jgi:hypothetical protein
MYRAALRRFAGLLLVIVLGTGVCSLLLGFATGASASRSLSLGFYVVGSFLLISGFFIGNRGPVRTKGDPGMPTVMGPIFRTRMLRWASQEEIGESLSLSVVFVALGLVLIFLGALTDTRYSLV